MEESKEKPKLTFYILTRHSKEPVRDFQQFIADLNYNWGLNIIQNNPKSAQTSNNMGYSAQLNLLEQHEFQEKGFRMCIELTHTAEDESTLRAIRTTLKNARFEYQTFWPKYQTFIPQNEDLLLTEVGSYNVESHRILNNYHLNPVYYYQKTGCYYAINPKGEVEIINKALMNFIYNKEIPEKELPELSYVVSPSIQKFGYMFDRNLIPTRFYEYYNRPRKIINESFIDVNQPGRKIFIKPYIMELQEERNEFYTQAGEGSSLLHMDKIRNGETLDDAIKRILKEDLKIADDYIGAYVLDEIEFDRDKEGIITPRIIVTIYVEKINNREWALKMSQTSWRSLDGSLASASKNDN